MSEDCLEKLKADLKEARETAQNLKHRIERLQNELEGWEARHEKLGSVIIMYEISNTLPGSLKKEPQ